MRKRNILVAFAASVAALALAAPDALADPAPAGPRILVGVGSDTTQDVMNGLAAATATGGRIGSYDATGAATLPNTKSGTDCAAVARPVGSRNGVAALVASRQTAQTAGVRPCVDFARSSADLSQDPQFANTALTFIPFAGDQVSYVTRRDSALPTTLTTAQLAAIYNCTAAGTIANPPTILPLLPQAGSGTRSFFLASIGVTTPGACVSAQDPTNPAVGLIENNGVKLTDPRMIAPYSVAQFNSQYYKAVTDVKGPAELRRVGGAVPGSAAFPFKREVFNVVPTGELGDPNISAIFVGSNDASDLCNQGSVITQFGFTQLDPARCGAIVPALQSSGTSTDLTGPSL